MAVTPADAGAQLPYSQTPDRYTSLGDLVNGTKDDVRDIYAAIYGDQGLSGLVEVIGAKKSAGSSDETVWFEEGRLGTRFVVSTGTITSVDGAQPGETQTDEQNWVRANDVLLSNSDKRFLVEAVSSTAITAKDLSTNDATAVALPSGTYTIIGNAYAQGTNQPSQPFSPRLTRRVNPFTIVKESFHVTGSQASNIGWVNVGGQNMWYLKGELDARRKFLNMREGMMVFGQKPTTTVFNQDVNDIAVPVNEGFFDAIEDRGIIGTNALGTMADFDEVIVAADAQGIPAENALYLSTSAMLDLDSAIANAGTGTYANGAMSSYGAFNNDKDMAIAMGFKSFTRGGYTFHKHTWKLLNDPTMGGVSSYKGGLIPLSIITDMKTGNRHHSLEMNYKSAGNYSRELEHWVEGGGVLGYNTGGEDLAKFNYRSECNLCVRGANQFVAFK